MQQRPTIRRAAEREQRSFDPPAPGVEPTRDTTAASAPHADFSIATLNVLPDVTPVARKIQRQENDDRHPTPGPSPASPPNPPAGGAEQLDASGQGSTTILAPTVAFKVYSGKTLQDVSNQLPAEAGSLTFDIGAATTGDPITRATVTVKQAMELPRWAERDAQCKPIQASWDRFISALRQHENEHVTINKQQLAKAHDRYVGKAQSETQNVTTELENETDAAGKAFDAQTDHGRTATPSTTIDLGAKCSDKTTTGEPGPEPEELQAKLEVSEPGDPDEEEADRVAEQVMRMADPRAGAPLRLVSGGAGVQRCAACEAEEEKQKNSQEPESQLVRRKCAECEAKEQASSRVADITKSGGQPLDAETRAFMEPRFGYDFSRVRIHSDGEAAIAARSVSAHAYTFGDSVVFGAGRYAPATTEGRRLLAHELTHVVQQKGAATTVARQPTATPPAPAAPSGTPPLDPQAMMEKDKKAFESATRKVGSRAISVFLHVPKGPEDMKSAEAFTIQSVVDRSNGGETRKGFESESVANAYASMNAGPAGAAVLIEDGVFLVAKLSPNPNLSLIVHKPSMPSMSVGDILLGRWGGKLVKSDWNKFQAIYRIDPAPGVGVRMVVGQDGMLFPQSYFNAPDPGAKYRGLDPSGEGGIPTDAGTGGASASQLKPDQLPSSPGAADLRKIAGIDDVGGKSELKPEQQEAFITSYFRSRAEESLNANERTATQLQSDFKPATKDDASAPGSPIKKNAKAMIDSSRELAKDLRTILETEAIIKGRLDYVETAISRAVGAPGAMKLTIDGKERLAVDWKADYRSALKEIAAGVIQIRSASPMLALMVPDERKPPPTTAADAAGTGAKVVSGILNPISIIPNLAADKDVRDAALNRQTPPTGTNQVDASLFGSAPSAENDEKLRESFEKKLDTTLQAIRRARGEIVHGDLDQLLGLPGLRLQVGADLKKSAGLNTKLEEMLAAHEIKEIAWTIAETTVQVGALFLPGGAFISAAIGFGLAARDMGKDLKNLDIAAAGAIDPSTALITQQEAESRLVASTLMVALAALDLGSAAMPELHAAKVLTADAEGVKKGFELEIKGIKGADGLMHEVGLSRIGIRRCSDTCLLLAESLRVRGQQLTTVPGNADPAWFALQKELEPQINGLRSRAESVNQKAIESYNLPEAARRAEQEKLLKEGQAIELEMTKIEHRVFNLRGDILPAAEKSEWLPATQGGKVIPGEGFWMPSDPKHPAYRFCQQHGPIPYHARYPNFTKWAQMEITLPNFTARADDFALADQAMAARLFEKDPHLWGKGRPPNRMPDPEKVADYRRRFEMTWHHKENTGTLQLVPRELHYVPHSGGISADVAAKTI